MKCKYNIIWNGYTVCPDNWGMTNVTEVFHRLYYIYGGEAYCIYNDEAIPLEPGKLYLFPILQPYTMWQKVENPLDVLWFHVEMDFQLCQEVLAVQVEKESVFWHLLEALRMLSNKAEYFEALSSVFDAFLSQLCEKLHIDPYPGKSMWNVLKYIDENMGKELSVEVLADYAGMDRSYFSRKFRTVFHMSPKQYLIAKKMKTAARELMVGSSVYQAARAAGYGDEKAFSRAFKKYMELSPAKYRDGYIAQP